MNLSNLRFGSCKFFKCFCRAPSESLIVTKLKATFQGCVSQTRLNKVSPVLIFVIETLILWFQESWSVFVQSIYSQLSKWIRPNGRWNHCRYHDSPWQQVNKEEKACHLTFAIRFHFTTGLCYWFSLDGSQLCTPPISMNVWILNCSNRWQTPEVHLNLKFIQGHVW